jgi:CBS domain-containing protein
MVQVLDKISTVLAQKGPAVWSVSPDSTVYHALEVIAEKGIGAILVTQGSSLLGIFSERDYARKVVLKGRSSKETKVSEVMVSDLVVISPDSTVDDAMHKMTDHRIRHLPVVDHDGTVVGVLSIGDLVRWIIESHEQTITHLHNYIAGQYHPSSGYIFRNPKTA